ncbi:hypothetical protein VUR80DRAFT_1554 [Thermomyces stellatus]
MAFPGGNVLPPDTDSNPLVAACAAGAAALGGLCLYSLVSPGKNGGDDQPPGLAKSFFLFFYSCFIKPHRGDGSGTQQDALESFYKKQAGAYDATRRLLLQGREDMLALVSAQLQVRARSSKSSKKRRVWVDVCDISRLFPSHQPRENLVTEDTPTDLQRAGRRRHGLQHRGHVPLRRRPHLLLERVPRRLLAVPLRRCAEAL